MLSSVYSTIFGLALGMSVASAATLNVTVGANGQKAFEPNTVTAAMGDIVNFIFMGGNHTATQSTFAEPCTAAGFKSGFQPVASTGKQTTFSILVNTTTPIWVYCAQPGHCQSGMVMAVNAATTGNKTFSAFQQLAMGATSDSSGGASGSTPSGTATVAAVGGSSSASATVSGPGGSATPTQSGSTLMSATPSSFGLIIAVLVSAMLKLAA